MSKAADTNEPGYGIAAVARLTGLTDHTIRIWERRYGAVATRKAANGRRVYSAADVEKLGYLKRLTDQGFSIGQIAADTIGQLRQQIKSLGDLSTAAVPDEIAVAVLGDYLPAQLQACDRNISPLQVTVADSNRDRFAADLRCQNIDVVVLERPVLDAETSAQLTEFMKNCGAERGIIIYHFGRSRDVEMARMPNIVAVRAPVDVDQLHATVIRSYTQSSLGATRQEKKPHDDVSDWRVSEPVAARIFNQQQLVNLANATSAIDCECPQHLAELVSDLSAFEIYSANCANRNDDDAALHRYLHQTTAQARALIEMALEKVARAEGLNY